MPVRARGPAHSSRERRVGDQRRILSTSPENIESPLSETHGWVTPNRLFFVRSHFATPELDLARWRLAVTGCVERELSLTWDQLNALPQRSLFATLECAGNGRSFLQQRVEGIQWQAGAVGHAEWTGVPLRYLLAQARVRRDATEIVFEGADRGSEKDHPAEMSFARSLPLEKAQHPDTLLVTRMNGEVLEPSHGFPARLLVPGWFGVASVKWLTRIEAVAEPFHGYYQSVKYTVRRRTGRGVETEVVGAIAVKSEILRPAGGAVLGVGPNRIFGLAWAGEDAVAAVEISLDDGRTWRQTELNGPRAPYAWTLWEHLWDVRVAGEYTLLARAVSDRGEVQPMRHDPLRGGYLVSFARPTRVTVDAARFSSDFHGDVRALEREMQAVAEERARLPLDVEMEFVGGAGI
jgi:DMSO/TMAO reductase YedYZ molybdopterin-dependent catalytic subunit